MLLHPIIVRCERAHLECDLAADHVDEKARCSLKIRHRYANVIRTSQSRQSHFPLPSQHSAFAATSNKRDAIYAVNCFIADRPCQASQRSNKTWSQLTQIFGHIAELLQYETWASQDAKYRPSHRRAELQGAGQSWRSSILCFTWRGTVFGSDEWEGNAIGYGHGGLLSSLYFVSAYFSLSFFRPGRLSNLAASEAG